MIYDEPEIVNAMPPAMRNDFGRQLYAQYLESVPMFRGLR